MRRLFYEDLGFGIEWLRGWVAAVILVLVGATLVGGLYLGADHVCARKADALERDYRFGVFEGCLIEGEGGEYVPLKNWRAVTED